MSFPHALVVGDRAADFELPNARGRQIRLADQLERGPVVL
jgi:peroxiredoxin